MYRSQQRQRTIFSLLLAGLGGCASTTMSPSAQSAQIGTSVRSDANVLALLHASNVGEITSSVMAQARATDSAVKAFAAMMVSEHTTLDQQGNALATQIGVTPALPDSTLPQIQRNESDSLRGATAGADFDRTVHRAAGRRAPADAQPGGCLDPDRAACRAEDRVADAGAADRLAAPDAGARASEPARRRRPQAASTQPAERRRRSVTTRA